MSETPETIAERVERVRAILREEGLDALLVRSTDRYLNEYVPAAESTRQWVTGFTGSTGDALVGLHAAWLVVDGRYYLQADEESAGTPFAVEKVPLGTAVRTALFRLVRRLAREGRARRVAYEPDRFTVKELQELRRELAATEVELVPALPSPVERVRGDVAEPIRPVRHVGRDQAGLSVAEKLARTRSALEEAGAQAFVVARLDELAWLTNLRGGDFPMQATFRAVGVLFPERIVVATPEPDRVPEAGRGAGVEVVGPDAWPHVLPATGKVGYDPAGTTAHVLGAIEGAGAEAVALTSPIAELKAIKNEAELRAMKDAFARADAVMEEVIAFVHAEVDAGRRLTEGALAREVERRFRASGAVDLSFAVIAAAGTNAAQIHGQPDPERELRAGELLLIDTGAYYDAGFATDLTRTVLVGSRAEPTAEQRRYFTLVLKAAIAGMTARFPEGSRGDQLDAITRAPLWAAGLDYNHGTGHGVGVNVHEAPPRVSTKGAGPVRAGQVFSIEPGVYLPEFGGIRIENLCTAVASEGAPGFLDVVPLTTAALDERLIDPDLLTGTEEAFLARYAEQRRRRSTGGR